MGVGYRGYALGYRVDMSGLGLVSYWGGQIRFNVELRVRLGK